MELFFHYFKAKDSRINDIGQFLVCKYFVYDNYVESIVGKVPSVKILRKF